MSLPWEGSKSDSSAAVPSSPSRVENQAAKPPVASGLPAQAAPVETYLTPGTMIPSRVKATHFTVHFRSNAPLAVFECSLNLQEFTPCVDDSFTFRTIVQGQAYSLKVRALTADGLGDLTPLEVNFVGDLLTGDPPEVPVKGKLIEHASDIPLALAPGEAEEGRTLQVGSLFGVVLPAEASVLAYATDRTYNTVLRTFRLVDGPTSWLYESQPCNPAAGETFATITPAVRYCEATPSTEAWGKRKPAPLPRNHLEWAIGGGPKGRVSERLIVAASRKEEQLLNSPLKGTTCARAMTSGHSAIAAVPGFFLGTTRTVSFAWCQIRDEQGVFWWVGSFDFPGQGEAAETLQVTYAVNTQVGIFSGGQFAARAQDKLTGWLVALALDGGP